MINKLPFLGWLISIIASISMSIPFWLFWTSAGLGARYFYWLPDVYLRIPFWHCVGLFIIVSILKSELTPTLASVSNKGSDVKVNVDDKKKTP